MYCLENLIHSQENAKIICKIIFILVGKNQSYVFTIHEKSLYAKKCSVPGEKKFKNADLDGALTLSWTIKKVEHRRIDAFELW